MKTKRITVSNLGKSYRIGETRPIRDFASLFVPGIRKREKFWALENINLNISDGETVGIVGPNGAGKSTLLKILSSITAPTTGEARLYGRVGSLLEVGTGFSPELTGRENVYMNGSILGLTQKEINNKLDEIVAFSGVEVFLDTPVKRYSSGMRLRLAFSVAAHLEPEILIIDEVLAVGDLEFQRKCLGKLDTIKQAGRTVLFVSHNMSAILSLCTRVCVMQMGKIQYDGDVERGIAHYINLNSEGKTQESIYHRKTEAGGLALFIKKVELLNSIGETATIHYWDQPIKFMITLKSTEPLPFATLNVAIHDNSGNKICHIRDDDYLGHSLTDGLQSGEHTFSLKIQSKLFHAGEYSVSFSISIKKQSSYDKVEHALKFSILRPEDQGKFVVVKRRGSLVLPDVEWS